MPYTKQDLQNLYSISPEDVELTLKVAKLPLEHETYTDEDIQSGFDVIRKYFNNGQANDYSTAALLFEQQGVGELEEPLSKAKKSNKGKKSSNSIKPLTILELLTRASEQTGKSISLTEAIKILQVCGLSEQEE